MNRRIFRSPVTTVMLRMLGNGFESSGVFDGDLLIADRSVEPCDGQLVVAEVGGRQDVRRFAEKGGKKFLTDESGRTIDLGNADGIGVVAVVTYTIHTLPD